MNIVTNFFSVLCICTTITITKYKCVYTCTTQQVRTHIFAIATLPVQPFHHQGHLFFLLVDNLIYRQDNLNVH